VKFVEMIDDFRASSGLWLSGTAGSGKTTLIASYVNKRQIPCIWYQMDAGDNNSPPFSIILLFPAAK